MPVTPVRPWQHFVNDVVAVLLVTPGTGTGVMVVGVPAFTIHSIDAGEVEVPVVDQVGERVVHATIFPLEESPTRRGERDHSRATVAELQQLHVSME